MKTIKVTIPGTESTWRVKATGELCQIVKGLWDINTVIGKFTNRVEIKNNNRVFARDSDIEEILGTPETTREFRVPKPRDDGVYCDVAKRLMSCRDTHQCADCIYHYLATL